MAFGRGNAGDSLRKEGLRIGRPKTKKNYQKFFDGWVEYREKDSRGREHNKMLYVADYHVCDLDMNKRIAVRILYVLLLLGAMALFLAAGTRFTAFNLAWYVGISTAAAFLVLAWTAVRLLVHYVPGARRMTNFTYDKAITGVRTGSKIGAVALGCCALLTLFSLVFHREDAGAAFLCAAQYCAAAGMLLAMYFVEGKIGYHKEPSGNKAPIGSVYVATMEEVVPPKKKESVPAGTITNDDLFAPDPVEP